MAQDQPNNDNKEQKVDYDPHPDCEAMGCDIPDGHFECRRCGAEAVDDDELETETLTMEVTWSQTVEVPKGWRPGRDLSDFPASVLDQLVGPPGGSITDWK